MELVERNGCGEGCGVDMIELAMGNPSSTQPPQAISSQAEDRANDPDKRDREDHRARSATVRGGRAPREGMMLVFHVEP